MRWALLVNCLLVLSCGNEPDEKPSIPVATNQPPALLPSDSIDSFSDSAKDTSTHASFTVPAVKRPSGIWEFIMPYDATKKIQHTVSFSATGYTLQEEYLDTKDSTVITEGTWAPSQGMIWLYQGNIVRGRYTWEGDTLQYFSPRLNKKFSMVKLTPASANPVWQTARQEGAILYGVGTEPFWSVEVKGEDSIILRMPELTEPLRVKLTGTQVQAKNTVYSTAADDSLQIKVSPYFCSDGMSDFTYTNKIIITYRGRTLQGCGVVF